MLCRRIFQIKAFIYHSSFSMSMDSIAKSKQFDLAEEALDKSTQFKIKREKTIFSRDEKSAQFQLLDVKAPEVNEKKDVHYAYEKEIFTAKPRFVYNAPIRKRLKKQIQQKEYENYKFSELQKAERLKLGLTDEEVTVVDELWNNEPPIRYFAKVLAKELYFQYRNPSFKQVIDRKNVNLTHFARPFLIHNQDVKTIIEYIKQKSLQEFTKIHWPNYCLEEDFYAKNPDLRDKFELLSKLVATISYKELPALSLSIAYDLNYKVDVFKVWKAITEQVQKHIHHYTPLQLIQLKHAFAGCYPKAGDYSIHQALLQLVLEDLNSLNLSELLHAFQAFRLVGKENKALKFVDKIVEKLEAAKGDEIANSFYSVASNLPKLHQKKKTDNLSADYNQRLKYMMVFEGKLKENASEMSLDGVTRVLLGVRLMRLAKYDDLVLVMEKRIEELQDQIEAFHCHQILYSLSKGGNGFSVGQVQTYELLSNKVAKYWHQFEDLEKSRMFYAYSAHGVIKKEDLDKLYLPWLKERMSKLSYAELQNAVYGLMFTNTNDKEIWMDFVRNVARQEEVCPLVNYMALKQAKYFVRQYYPEWNWKPFDDTCYEAENQISALRTHRSYDDNENVQFTQFMGLHFNDLEMKTLYIFDNMYYLQIVLEEPKIAIINQSLSLTLPQGGPRPQLLMRKQILESVDWKVIIVDFQHVMNLPRDEKQLFLRKMINEALAEQKPKIKKWEQKRRDELTRRIKNLAERTITEGKQMMKPEDEKYFERKVT